MGDNALYENLLKAILAGHVSQSIFSRLRSKIEMYLRRDPQWSHQRNGCDFRVSGYAWDEFTDRPNLDPTSLKMSHPHRQFCQLQVSDAYLFSAEVCDAILFETTR